MEVGALRSSVRGVGGWKCMRGGGRGAPVRHRQTRGVAAGRHLQWPVRAVFSTRDYSGPHPAPRVRDSQDDQLGDTGLSREHTVQGCRLEQGLQGRRDGLAGETGCGPSGGKWGWVFSEHLPGKARWGEERAYLSPLRLTPRGCVWPPPLPVLTHPHSPEAAGGVRLWEGPRCGLQAGHYRRSSLGIMVAVITVLLLLTSAEQALLHVSSSQTSTGQCLIFVVFG